MTGSSDEIPAASASRGVPHGIAAAAVLVVASILTAAMMIESRPQKRSGGQLPPGPARRELRGL